MSKVLLRLLHTSARRLVRKSRNEKEDFKWLGFDREGLPQNFKKAVEDYVENGARKKIGKVASINILRHMNNATPIHYSRSNPKDKELIIRAQIAPRDGSKARVHHVYPDGTGTIRINDRRE